MSILKALEDKEDMGINTPNTLDEALRRARSLLSQEDIELMRTEPLHVVIARLHLTLGHQIRGELDLWSEAASSLREAIANALPNYPVFDADSASAAVIALLWEDIRK
jgi:hypothetical protein